VNSDPELAARNRDRKWPPFRRKLLLDGCLSIIEAELWHGRLPSSDNGSAEDSSAFRVYVSDVTVGATV
jgi:hypothetical protein